MFVCGNIKSVVFLYINVRLPMRTPMTNNELWQSVLGELELQISRPSFTTWFSNTYIHEFCNGKIVVGVPNTFAKTWLEKKFHKQILNIIQTISQTRIREILYLIIPKSKNEISLSISQTPIQKTEEIVYSQVNTNTPSSNGIMNNSYIFSSFVVGKTNELAYAACKAVASKPGQVYNPLFIYGGVGLGKTHLIQAIGNTMISQGTNPRKIMYVSSEKFTNDYIQKIKAGRAEEFKDIYRNVDLLLIDDVQFFSGKERTQEEFFHTFNHLHQLNKQIVLTADRPPKEIRSLENRLLSRFEWGMIADISAPDLETRIAIFEKKCQEKNFLLEKNIVAYIAENITSNIRELEGVLNRIIAIHELQNKKPDMTTIEQIISAVHPRKTKGSITPKNILSIVAEYYGIGLPDLLGQSREKRLSFPRQIVMFLLREELNHSFPSIGHEIGGRDHTTALHAHGKISRESTTNERLKNDLELLKEKMYQVV